MNILSSLGIGGCLGWALWGVIAGDGCAQDDGSDELIDRTKNAITNLIANAEKSIPRDQKYLILKRAEKQLLASNPFRLQEALSLADGFRRYRFYDEAEMLYQKVHDSDQSDSAQKTRSMRYLGELAFVAKSSPADAIRRTRMALKTAEKDSVIRGKLLSNLGSYYFVSDRLSEMKEVFDEFLQLPDEVKRSLPKVHFKANLYNARHSQDPVKSRKYFDQAETVVGAHPGVFDLALVLSVKKERWELGKWNSPERIAQIDQWVNDESYQGLSELVPLAMDVYLARFLEYKKDWKRFSTFHKKMVALIEANEKSKKVNDQLSHFARQVIAMHAFAAKTDQRDFNQVEAKNEFLGWGKKDKSIRLYFPNGVTRDQLTAFRNAFVGGARDALRLEEKKKRKKQG